MSEIITCPHCKNSFFHKIAEDVTGNASITRGVETSPQVEAEASVDIEATDHNK
jgi:hypothetical protein